MATKMIIDQPSLDISSLPFEILVGVMSFLNKEDVVKCSLVCRINPYAFGWLWIGLPIVE